MIIVSFFDNKSSIFTTLNLSVRNRNVGVISYEELK